jgi:hypothetical protein
MELGMNEIEGVARRIWACDWRTIVSVKTMNPGDREALQAAILKKYGRSIDLTAGPDRIRNAVVEAQSLSRSVPVDS